MEYIRKISYKIILGSILLMATAILYSDTNTFTKELNCYDQYCLYECLNECFNGSLNECLNECSNECSNEYSNECLNEYSIKTSENENTKLPNNQKIPTAPKKKKGIKGSINK